MKYYFWILGCAMNYSDAERMAAVFNNMGHKRTLDEKDADIFVVISCSVRQSAILKIYGKVKDLKDRKTAGKNLTTILTGCVLAKDKKKLGKVFDIMVETKDIEELPNLINNLNKFELLPSPKERNAVEYFKIAPDYDSDFRAFVPISTGCDNFCSYCAVPYTRGREKSRPSSKIIEEVKNLIRSGYKEITLVGQNVNSYGKDLEKPVISSNAERSSKEDSSTSVGMTRKGANNSFINLLLDLDKIPGDHRIYFYSNHPKDMTDELIQALSTLEHFPHYIHLPLQSGNDEILNKMNRHSNAKAYLELVIKIRDVMPDVTLTTDIIVGYPGETDAQLIDTANVMKIAEYDMAFIAQYSPREGTVSSKQPDDVTKEEKRNREAILQEIVKDTVLKHNEKLVGTTQKVLIDEQKGDKYYGRTAGYKVVEVKTDQPLQVGQFIDVNIESAGSWKLFARI